MKYKCKVCGQIIDSNEMCPICGSDSSQIIPLDDNVKKGHYRCLVCDHETDQSDYCPYCGSQNLFDLDNNKAVNDVSKDVEVAFDFTKEKQSLEEEYASMFNEPLPINGINNPDQKIIDDLCRTAIERKSKLTRDEVLQAFNFNEYNGSEKDSFEDALPGFSQASGNLGFKKEERDILEKPVTENEFLKSIIQNLTLLIVLENDELTKKVLCDVRDNLVKDVVEVEGLSSNELHKKLMKDFKDFVYLKNIGHTKNARLYEKYFKLLEVLFDGKEN